MNINKDNYAQNYRPLYTFGSSKAAISLEQLIEEITDPIEQAKIRSRISSYFSDYVQTLKTLALIDKTHSKQKRFLYNLLIEDIKYNFRKEVPEKIKTHAINVLVAKAREIAGEK